MKYVYPCVVEKRDNDYLARFPDFSRCDARGATLYETLCNAESELLTQMYWYANFYRRLIPQPTPLKEIKLKDGEFATLIKGDTYDVDREFLEEEAENDEPHYLDLHYFEPYEYLEVGEQ